MGRPVPSKKMIYDILTILCFPLSLKIYRAIPASGQFRCDDERLTFRVPDSGETVPVRLLFQSCYIPVIFIIVFGEFMNSKSYTNAFKDYIRYLSCQSINCVVNLLLKTLASTPRPHFFSTCQPDWSRISCEGQGLVTFDSSLCQSTFEDGEDWRLTDSMRSFPSGHSQMAFCCAAFFTLYLQKRLAASSLKTLRLATQAMLIILALACAVSRLVDHRHHPEDVVAGSLIGSLTGLLAARTIITDETNLNRKVN